MSAQGGGGESSRVGGGGERTVRGRGGFRQTEENSIPAGIQEVHTTSLAPGETGITVLANYVRISPMSKREIYQYRVDFEPNVESERARRKIFRETTTELFLGKAIFDGANEARCGIKTPDEVNTFTMNHPFETNLSVTMKLKRGKIITSSPELTRIYNTHIRRFLRILGFVQFNTGAFVDLNLSSNIGNSLSVSRGFKTGANLHQNDQILMNLESCHKLLQRESVLDLYNFYRANRRREDFTRDLTGKLVVTRYKKNVYRIEDIRYDLNPASTFHIERTNTDITYADYLKNTYNIEVTNMQQPLLVVVNNNNRQRFEGDAENVTAIHLVPELCNIAGLTEQQKENPQIRLELIQSSQIRPEVRVEHLKTFLRRLHDNEQISEMLNNWGYSYDTEPIEVKGRILERMGICNGAHANLPRDKWPKVEDGTASFEKHLKDLMVVPDFPKLALIITQTDRDILDPIKLNLKKGFERLNMLPRQLLTFPVQQGDREQMLVGELRNLPSDITAAVVILPKKSTKETTDRYNAVKRLASVDRGLITQCITSKLLRKDNVVTSACFKIAIQLAAKVGGEPWHVHIPMPYAMICGYDTYHDTSQRGRSYGAFVASMNGTFSRWYSKADRHDVLNELSTNMSRNLDCALERYKELNNRYPDRVVIYRDGVGDGQLDHVRSVELEQIEKAIRSKDGDIKLALIIVNKRIGARFYWKTGNTFKNPPPGSVIDNYVTRKGRYDFYLTSQSTRHGTVTPTYYNIIADDTGLNAFKHQVLAFKLCFLYYNWAGTVRVPAPCQYAHKLAKLCGENLLGVPNVNLDDKLHFL